tara:strand:- start:149 stop:508 length:360 start_codon:yes stop_codon:yes gene_type:complete
MRFEYFLSLLKHSEFIIGNSSSVVRESPVYGVPAINLGARQKNRSQSNNIIECKIIEKNILKAIQNVRFIKKRKRMIFGTGDTASRFLKILNNKKFWETSKIKYFNKLNLNENNSFTRS